MWHRGISTEIRGGLRVKGMGSEEKRVREWKREVKGNWVREKKGKMRNWKKRGMGDHE